jgi:hypothetical protein
MRLADFTLDSVSGFDHTLHNFYTVPDCTCAPYDAVFAGTLACKSVATARATISRLASYPGLHGLGNRLSHSNTVQPSRDLALVGGGGTMLKH